MIFILKFSWFLSAKMITKIPELFKDGSKVYLLISKEGYEVFVTFSFYFGETFKQGRLKDNN